METQSLRINNIVKSGKGLYKIVALSTNGIEAVLELDSDKIILSNSTVIIQPIEITKDILDKTNLKKTGVFSDYRFSTDETEYNYDFITKCIGVVNDNVTTNFIWDIDELHKLQNIFYNLTNKELKVFLKTKHKK